MIEQQRLLGDGKFLDVLNINNVDNSNAENLRYDIKAFEKELLNMNKMFQLSHSNNYIITVSEEAEGLFYK